MKKQRAQKLDPGDIPQMMVDSQSRTSDDQTSEGSLREDRKLLTPIISIEGKDVDWHELEFSQRKNKDKAA